MVSGDEILFIILSDKYLHIDITNIYQSDQMSQHNTTQTDTVWTSFDFLRLADKMK